MNLTNKKQIWNLLSILLSVFFFFSAISKIFSIGYFEITLIDQEIVEYRTLAAYLTRFIIGLELFIGFHYLFYNRVNKIISYLTILFTILFTIHLIILLTKGDNENCGCFGNIINVSPIESVIKNIFIIFLLIIFHIKKTFKKGFKIHIILFILMLFLAFIIKPISINKKNIFNKFIHFENIGRVDLSNENKIIAVFNTNCDHCKETAKIIKQYTNNQKKKLPLFILFYEENNITPEEFFKETQISYPYQIIEIEDFFNLIGSQPPRIYILKEGEIVQHWDSDFKKHFENYKLK